MALCKKLENSRCSLKVINSSWLCRYHMNKAEYPMPGLTNMGLCPEAFHNLYPLAFSMIYTYEKNGNIECSCPGKEGNTIFQVEQIPVGWVHSMYNRIKRSINLLYTSELRHYNVLIRVKTTNSACPYHYRTGDSFMLNLVGGEGICPAAFYNIFPSIMSAMYAYSNGSMNYVCPDHKRNILFRLKDRDKTIAIADGSEEYQCCADYSNVVIDVTSVSGNCYKGYRIKDRFMLEDILEKLGFPCLTALHSLYPYISTLLKGGKLGFYTHSYDSAAVQCPNINVKVEMIIEKIKNDAISVEVLNLKDKCPKNLTKGNRFLFSYKQLDDFCLSALMAMHPYLIHNKNLLPQEVNCPGRDGKVCFYIS